MEARPPSPSPAGNDAEKPGTAGGSRWSTPIVVAVLGLSGVLGSALLANWDKIFRSPSRPAPATAVPPPGSTGAQSPVVSGVSGPVTINYGSAPAAPSTAPARLQGVWLSAPSQHPYQPDRRFRLRLELQASGSEWSGQVSDVPEGRGSGPVFPLQAAKPAGEGLDFQVDSTWCCEDGKSKSYQIFYQLRPAAQGLTLTRRNNSPGGGQLERFELARSP